MNMGRGQFVACQLSGTAGVFNMLFAGETGLGILRQFATTIENAMHILSGEATKALRGNLDGLTTHADNMRSTIGQIRKLGTLIEKLSADPRNDELRLEAAAVAAYLYAQKLAMEAGLHT